MTDTTDPLEEEGGEGQGAPAETEEAGAAPADLADIACTTHPAGSARLTSSDQISDKALAFLENDTAPLTGWAYLSWAGLETAYTEYVLNAKATDAALEEARPDASAKLGLDCVMAVMRQHPYLAEEQRTAHLKAVVYNQARSPRLLADDPEWGPRFKGWYIGEDPEDDNSLFTKLGPDSDRELWVPVTQFYEQLAQDEQQAADAEQAAATNAGASQSAAPRTPVPSNVAGSGLNDIMSLVDDVGWPAGFENWYTGVLPGSSERSYVDSNDNPPRLYTQDEFIALTTQAQDAAAPAPEADGAPAPEADGAAGTGADAETVEAALQEGLNAAREILENQGKPLAPGQEAAMMQELINAARELEAGSTA